MVVYNLTKCRNYSEDEAGEYENSDLYCLEKITNKRPIKHGDTIRFPNNKEYVVEFVKGELAVMLLRKSSNTKMMNAPRHLPTLIYYYGSSSFRDGNGRDQYAYELMVKDARCFLRHGDLLITGEDRFMGSCFVDIDKEKKEFRLMTNPDESGSGYFSIPLELSKRVDNVFNYFSEHISYIYDNNVIIDISSRDKVFDVILHPELLKERNKIIAYIYQGDLTISFGEKGPQHSIQVNSVYKLLQENDVVKKVWRNIPSLPKEYERNVLSALYPTYANEIPRDLWDVLNEVIEVNIEIYENQQAQKRKKALAQKEQMKALALKEKMKKDASMQRKKTDVPKVHKGTFANVNMVLATKARKIVKDAGVTVRNVVIEAMGDDEAVKRAFQNLKNMKRLDKAPPGKVLNPSTNRFINVDGALARKLGLAKVPTPKKILS